LLAAYLVIGIGLYFFQEKLLFHPVKVEPGQVYRFEGKFEELNLVRPDGTNLNMVRFMPSDSLPRGIILYYHGNMRNIERYAPFASLFTGNGYEVWMMDYAGFGKSTGKRSEENMYADAVTVYQLAAKKMQPDSICIYGKSIGTGVAAHVAAGFPCKRLILETPYYSIPSMVKRWFFMYPVNLLVRYRFPTGENMQKIKIPVTIFHGTDDEIISYKNAQKLVPLLKDGDEFVTLPNGKHNNLFDFPLYQDKMDSLLNLE
jgi:uncharacterized protein